MSKNQSISACAALIMPIIFTVVFQPEIYKTQVIMLLLQRKMQFATWLTRTAQVSNWLPPKSIANLLLIKGVDFCAQKLSLLYKLNYISLLSTFVDTRV